MNDNVYGIDAFWINMDTFVQHKEVVKTMV